jgi:DNA polymerase
MHRLKNAIKLKELYRLKALGFSYTDIFPSAKEESFSSLPDDMKALKEIISNCKLCQLHKTRNKIVFGDGNETSNLMFVGEAPGATEDYTGKPFVGQAGILLSQLIKETLNMDRKDYYIANIVKCRPPKNRVPTPEEAFSCLPYLKKQIQLVDPKIIVTLGSTAYFYLTGDKTPISRVRGEIFKLNGIFLIPTFHPSYLLRNKAKKKFVYEDFLKVKQLLSQL